MVTLFPGPLLLLTTWAQSLAVSGGRFLHLLTIKTQALQISPDRETFSLKQFRKEFSYFPLSVNLELKVKSDVKNCNLWIYKLIPAWFCFANTAAFQGTEHLWFMIGGHLYTSLLKRKVVLIHNSLCRLKDTKTLPVKCLLSLHSLRSSRWRISESELWLDQIWMITFPIGHLSLGLNKSTVAEDSVR